MSQFVMKLLACSKFQVLFRVAVKENKTNAETEA